MNQTVKALVVDDSAAMARFLSTIIDAHPELETVGTAADAFEARDQIKRLNPDVITLDIEMPVMDGLTALDQLVERCTRKPPSILMCSSLTSAGSHEAPGDFSTGRRLGVGLALAASGGASGADQQKAHRRPR